MVNHKVQIVWVFIFLGYFCAKKQYWLTLFVFLFGGAYACQGMESIDNSSILSALELFAC